MTKLKRYTTYMREDVDDELVEALEEEIKQRKLRPSAALRQFLYEWHNERQERAREAAQEDRG